MRQSSRVPRQGVPRAVALNLLASALTILATIVLLGAGMVVVEAPMTAPAGSETGAVARAFYEAVNEVLRTGDTVAIDRVATADILLHSTSLDAHANLDELKHDLEAMHAVAPGTQLAIDELIIAGDHAFVHLALQSGAAGTFLGVAFDATAPFWSRVDTIRSADGRVAEVWGGMEPAPRLASLGSVRLDALPTSPQPMAFERFESAAGDEWTSESTHLSRVVYVDAGELTVAVDSHAPAGTVTIGGRGGSRERVIEPGTRAAVGAGDMLRLGSGSRYALHHNAEKAGLQAYAVSFPRERYVGPLTPDRAQSPEAEHPDRPSPPERRVLVDSPSTELPRDPLVADFGRIELPPGTRLLLAEPAGPVLLQVEAGSLEVETFQGTGNAEERACDGAWTEAKRLAAGNATLVPMGVSAALIAGSGEPLVAFAVAIMPDHTRPAAAW